MQKVEHAILIFLKVFQNDTVKKYKHSFEVSKVRSLNVSYLMRESWKCHCLWRESDPVQIPGSGTQWVI